MYHAGKRVASKFVGTERMRRRRPDEDGVEVAGPGGIGGQPRGQYCDQDEGQREGESDDRHRTAAEAPPHSPPHAGLGAQSGWRSICTVLLAGAHRICGHAAPPETRMRGFNRE